MNEDPGKTVLRYFIDEARDTTLFGRRGKELVIGKDGVSKFFMLGKLRVDDADSLRKELTQLRADLLADPYFRGVPSMQPERGKTAFLFHAKDDLAEVRREVFKLLLKHDLHFYAVLRNKTEPANFVLQQNTRDPPATT